MPHAMAILDAARRLVEEKGDQFTTQELVKEAGVALKTFYRYFASKDQLLLVVIEDIIAAASARLAEDGKSLPDPLARLRFYITSTLAVLDTRQDGAADARLIVSTHWHLQRTHPDEIAEATRPFADLLLSEIRAGVDAGLLHPADPERAAWFINELVRSVYHHHAYAIKRSSSTGEDLWRFCLQALGGTPA